MNPFVIFLNQFKSFIIYILLFALVFSFLTGHTLDAIIIAIILVTNALIGFVQEYSAHRNIEAIKNMDVLKAKVIRDGKRQIVDADFLVPWDIIILEAGDKVPADARVLESMRCEVQEAVLTGESLAVLKHADPIHADVSLGDQKNMLFLGTSVVSGNTKALVVATGMSTIMGGIAKLITHTPKEITPLQKKLQQFGMMISIAVIIICIVIFALELYRAFLVGSLGRQEVIGLMIIALSVAVAAVPEALPIVVTIALSVGVKRLLQKNVLVRSLPSVETLGSCNVICTDKTGTLTKNEMTVTKLRTMQGESVLSWVWYDPHGEISWTIPQKLLLCGAICNNASLFQEGKERNVFGDPTEGALIVSARKAWITQTEYERIDEIPFDGVRKVMSVIIEEEKNAGLYIKGAPEMLIEHCSHVFIDDKPVALTAAHKKLIQKTVNDYASNGMRVLWFGYKNCKNKSDYTEENLVFIGLQAMIDAPRPDVVVSIQRAQKAGLRVIMITGDHPQVAQAIGESIGIRGKVITSQDCEKLSDSELAAVLKAGTNIFARIIPHDKQRIVSLLQRQGHVVAMLGDGVNDAPALKKANIWVAVGKATDVAKEVSDFILLDGSFTNIVNAIEEGRGIFDNIQKSIMLLLAGNLWEVLLVFIAVLLGFPLPMTAIMILRVNLVTDGLPALAYSVDTYDPAIMQRKPNSIKFGILPRDKIRLVIVSGALMGIIALGIFGLLNGASAAQHQLASTVVFNFIVLCQLCLIFIIRGTYRVSLFSNLRLRWLVLFTIALQAVLTLSPLGTFFRIVPIWRSELRHILGGIALYLGIFLLYQRFNTLLQKKKNIKAL